MEIINRRQGTLRSFLESFLTPSEQIMLLRRIHVARLLMAGWSMEDIRRKLRVGITTIRFIDRTLQINCGAYRSLFNDIEREVQKRKRTREALRDPFSFASLRRKYPLHFLLFTLALGDGKYLFEKHR